ncbi:glucodextranase DOMON-like domain-containing protein [Thermococcus sp.]
MKKVGIVSIVLIFQIALAVSFVSATTVAVDLVHGENAKYLIDSPTITVNNTTKILAPPIVKGVGDMKWAYFGTDSSLVNASNGSIEYLGNTITADALANVDVLILGQPNSPFSPDELQAIADWFAQGDKVLWVAADSDYGSGVQAQDTANAILDQLGYGNLRVDLCSVEDPSSNAGAGYRVVGHVMPDSGTPFAGVITQNFQNGGKVLYHGPGVVAWVDDNGDWHTLNATSKPPLTYRIVVTSENGTIVENNDPPANAYLAGDTGVFPLLAAQVVPLDNGKQSVLIVSGESPYGDYEPTWSPLSHGVKLDGPQFVSNILHWAAMVAQYGVPKQIAHIDDPVGDDHGPGTYTYPTNPVFNHIGLFDLTGVDIAEMGSYYVFSFHFKNLGGNPWNGPNGFSLQIIETYLDVKKGGNTSAIKLFKLFSEGPGSNVNIDPAHPWDVAFRISGWIHKLILANGTVLDDVKVSTDLSTNTITAIVPAKYIGNLSPDDRISVLVGSEDAYGSDEWRDVRVKAAQWRIGGADADAVKAGVAPRVMDVLVPSWFKPTQEEQLKSYDANNSKLATVRMIPVSDNYGMISVYSTPAGATVSIDGKDVGTSPVKYYLVPAGNHTITLSMKDYHDYTKTIVVEPEKAITINATLELLPGTITITSNPSGANVYLNGSYKGITPLAFNLAPGTYEVKLTKQDYKNYTTTITLNPGESKTISATLTPAFGYLSVDSSPTGAKVYVDGDYAGDTPLKDYKLSTGEHMVKIVKDGYRNFTKTVTVSPGGKASVTANLIPVITTTSSTSKPSTTTSSPSTTSPPTQTAQTTTGGGVPKTYILAGLLILGLIGGLAVKARSSTEREPPAKTEKLEPKKREEKPEGMEQVKTSPKTVEEKPATAPAERKTEKSPEVLPPGFPSALLSRYEPLEFLGEGGFAKVFKARRKKDGKIVALKIPRIDEKTSKTFIREASTWLHLDHPNIVKLYDVDILPVPYLEMEYVEGAKLNGKTIRTLDAYPKPTDEETALNLIRGIAEGLKHAHSKEIYHRDLKPLNVLLKSDLTPKITDWGLAKLGTMSSSRSVMGYTPLYAAPEHLMPSRYGHTDARTDIWQLGVTFYELLTGKLPFEGYTYEEVFGKIVDENYHFTPPSKLKPELAKYDGVFEKLLAKKKENRYQSVDEFLKDLEKLEESEKRKAELERQVVELRRSLSESMSALKRSTSAEEILRNRRLVVEALGKLALAYAELNDRAELLNTLNDLKFYTVQNLRDLGNAISTVEALIRENLPVGEDFIERLKVLVHEIKRENGT